MSITRTFIMNARHTAKLNDELVLWLDRNQASDLIRILLNRMESDNDTFSLSFMGEMQERCADEITEAEYNTLKRAWCINYPSNTYPKDVETLRKKGLVTTKYRYGYHSGWAAVLTEKGQRALDNYTKAIVPETLKKITPSMAQSLKAHRGQLFKSSVSTGFFESMSLLDLIRATAPPFQGGFFTYEMTLLGELVCEAYYANNGGAE